MSKQVTKQELIDALLKSINSKYIGHSPNCELRIPIVADEQYGRAPIVPRCNCGYSEWYIKTQDMLNRANR